MQAEILRLYVGGHSLCEIARRTHRARQTVTKVVRASDVEAMIREMKQKLLAESDAWLESINFAVETEPHGEMAFRLALAFGIIPSPEKKTKPAKQNGWESMDPHQLAIARELAMEAQRRAALPPLEGDEPEAQMQKTKVQPERKSRLFDSRD